MPLHSFNKQERLKSRKSIQLLFEEGHSINKYPLKLVFSIHPEDSMYFPAQFAFSVPKRLFKRAVDRNLIKRRMKEVHRLNKQVIYTRLKEYHLRIEAILIFTSPEKQDFLSIQTAYLYLIQKIRYYS